MHVVHNVKNAIKIKLALYPYLKVDSDLDYIIVNQTSFLEHCLLLYIILILNCCYYSIYKP